MRNIFWVVLFFILGINAVCEAKSPFSPAQIERIKVFKQQLGRVDKKTLERTIAELQKADDPQMALEIQETMAQVYTDIVAEKNVQDLSTREWLYGMVALNMANLQFGGGTRDPLSRMIVQKLKKSLPQTVISNPNFHVSVQ